MDAEALKALVIQLAAVAERLDQRSQSAVQQVEQAGARLEQRAHRLGSSSAEFTREVSNALQRQSGEFLGKGLGDSIGEFNSQLTSCARAAQPTAPPTANPPTAALPTAASLRSLGNPPESDSQTQPVQ